MQSMVSRLTQIVTQMTSYRPMQDAQFVHFKTVKIDYMKESKKVLTVELINIYK